MAAVAVAGGTRSALRREATGEAVQEEVQKASEEGKKPKKKGKPVINKKLRFADSVEPADGSKQEDKEQAEQNAERKAEDTSSAPSTEKTETQRPVDPAAARARRLQLSLKRLFSWHSAGGRNGGARGGPLLPTDRGGSPPTFVQKPTVRWPGCKGARSITAADLGSTVALWIVYSPHASASLALYHPHNRTIEEDLSLEAEPDAVVGVTFTAGELRQGLAGALLFGGKTATGEILNDSWFYRTQTSQWTRINFKGKPPSARCHHAAAYSATTRSFFISGGQGVDGEALQGTYELTDDINMFDAEVSSWFEVLLMSPLATPQTYGFAAATGNPNTSIHIFAVGYSSEGDGAVFSVGAVCSTLDICMFAQGIRDTKVVCEDSRGQVEGLRGAVSSAMEESRDREESLQALVTTTDSLTLKFKSLLQRIVEAQAEASATLQSVQAFATKARETASTTATKEAAAQRKIAEMEAKMKEFYRKLKKFERLMTMEKEDESE
ncbi:hypothetical protein Emag_005954 [Eimeria magna]